MTKPYPAFAELLTMKPVPQPPELDCGDIGEDPKVRELEPNMFDGDSDGLG